MSANRDIGLPDEFASTMQQLVAEAEKAIAPEGGAKPNAHAAAAQDLTEQFGALNERIDDVERALSSEGDLASRLRRMDEHMLALRNTESVNQRLFNSLHQELKDYRDNFLRESLQKPFIRDLIVLFDDLSSLSAQMESAGGGSEARAGSLSQWHANLENAIHAVVEIMHRMEVNQIEPKERVDRTLHRVVSYEPADFAEDEDLIVMRVKRGFVWHDQVLRPEEVVAKRFS